MILSLNETNQMVHLGHLLSWTSVLLLLILLLERVLHSLFSTQLTLHQCSHLSPLQQVHLQFNRIIDQQGYSRQVGIVWNLPERKKD